MHESSIKIIIIIIIIISLHTPPGGVIGYIKAQMYIHTCVLSIMIMVKADGTMYGALLNVCLWEMNKVNSTQGLVIKVLIGCDRFVTQIVILLIDITYEVC